MITTFAYKNPGAKQVLENQGYHIIDCRGLANPWSVVELRPLPGTNDLVIEYIQKNSRPELIDSLLNEAAKHDKVAFGCYGGHHRSVAMAHLLSRPK